MTTKSKSHAPWKHGPPEPAAIGYIKDDSITFDTSHAPWMKIALQECGKKIKENEDYDSFAKLWYTSLVQHETEHHFLSESLQGPTLSVTTGGKTDSVLVMPGLKERHPLLKAVLNDEVGRNLKAKNPEINKYFTHLRTDPDRDRKGRTWGISPVNRGAQSWGVTAWCAAFVNWCLQQAGAPHLGMATAASWLKFGTPLAKPVYGCVTIVPPAKSTGSTTGHVAFYMETKGDMIGLLGGNQSDQVKLSYFHKVLGYRWPTAFNYYLLDRERRGSAVV
jgi:uncharacterized protein (TIGR02594 family)